MNAPKTAVPQLPLEMGTGLWQIVSSVPEKDRGHADDARDSTGRSPYTFTFSITETEALDLVRGHVPALLQNAVISMLIRVQETPAEAVASMTKRKQRRTGTL